ncbi:MAG: hypothetical protein H7X80_09070 [bacterium]|nr:hypothetical protein [Candidatus Kapabacteria bacterium]
MIPGTIAWQKSSVRMTAVVDFAGALFRQQLKDVHLAGDPTGPILEPAYKGSIVEHYLMDGSVRVMVELFTQGALAYAVYGMDPKYGQLVFGSRNYHDKLAVRANSRLFFVYRTNLRGAPIPDLARLAARAVGGASLEFISFTASSDAATDNVIDDVPDDVVDDVVDHTPAFEIEQPGIVPRTVTGPIGTLPASEIAVW